MNSNKNLFAFALCAALASAACTTKSESAPAVRPKSDAASTDAAPDVSSVPTQDDADAKAAKEITKDNADAELEKLKKEISDGGN